MKAKTRRNILTLVGTIFETVIKVVLLIYAVTLIFRGASKAYDFGYRVFADEPMTALGGKTITVGITEDMTVEQIAQMLEEKGLIEDAKLFRVQELLSAKHGKLKPGIYDLATTMTAAEMMEIMSSEQVQIDPPVMEEAPQDNLEYNEENMIATEEDVQIEETTEENQG